MAFKHGGYNTPEYRSWYNMRTRCLNPKATRFENYGGRGIKVCKRWSSFEKFLLDMGPKPTPRHTIDRIDNDGDYRPKNCKWATYAEQAKHKRKPPPQSKSTRAKHANNAMRIKFWKHRTNLKGNGPVEGCPIRKRHVSVRCRHCQAAWTRAWRARRKMASLGVR